LLNHFPFLPSLPSSLEFYVAVAFAVALSRYQRQTKPVQSQLRRLDCLDWAERFETALGAYLNPRFACQRILTAVFAGSLSWNARAALIQIKIAGGAHAAQY
jgi:hypothetical protein